MFLFIVAIRLILIQGCHIRCIQVMMALQRRGNSAELEQLLLQHNSKNWKEHFRYDLHSSISLLFLYFEYYIIYSLKVGDRFPNTYNNLIIYMLLNEKLPLYTKSFLMECCVEKKCNIFTYRIFLTVSKIHDLNRYKWFGFDRYTENDTNFNS